jgi:hypothetical protein
LVLWLDRDRVLRLRSSKLLDRNDLRARAKADSSRLGGDKANVIRSIDSRDGEDVGVTSRVGRSIDRVTGNLASVTLVVIRGSMDIVDRWRRIKSTILGLGGCETSRCLCVTRCRNEPRGLTCLGGRSVLIDKFVGGARGEKNREENEQNDYSEHNKTEMGPIGESETFSGLWVLGFWLLDRKHGKYREGNIEQETSQNEHLEEGGLPDGYATGLLEQADSDKSAKSNEKSDGIKLGSSPRGEPDDRGDRDHGIQDRGERSEA